MIKIRSDQCSSITHRCCIFVRQSKAGIVLNEQKRNCDQQAEGRVGRYGWYHERVDIPLSLTEQDLAGNDRDQDGRDHGPLISREWIKDQQVADGTPGLATPNTHTDPDKDSDAAAGQRSWHNVPVTIPCEMDGWNGQEVRSAID